MRIARRFNDENFDQIRASLALATLLSLVPPVAPMLGLVAVLPAFQGVVGEVDRYLVRNLLPERGSA